MAKPPSGSNDALSGLLGLNPKLFKNDEESLRLLQLASQVPKGDSCSSRAVRTKEAKAGQIVGTFVPSASSSSRASYIHTQESNLVSASAPPQIRRRPKNFAYQQINDLEDSVAKRLTEILEESKVGVREALQRASTEADAAVTASRRSCAEAELAYMRLTPTTECSADAAATEVGLLASDVLSMIPSSEFTTSLGPSGLPEQVAPLLEACSRQVLMAAAHAPGNNKAAENALSVTRDLADLLLEVDRECQAMALALFDHDSGLPAGWIELLGLAATHGAASDAPQPSLAALERQLQVENDLLRAALQSSPPASGHF
eukprot:TRINITY_DN48185_c0_g1_i1.p1 TRINITY_DN48185_c0_g1~~TRINITY_DN48185_c0_g1_i1.p1  ORF type:complete len:338 (+),score=73.13 TRINITY_DN48185_c0_g1_i1:65-1015(+)